MTRTTSDLLVPTATSSKVILSKGTDAAYNRFRTMAVDPGALPGDQGGSVKAALFDDTVVTLELGPATTDALGTRSWTGYVVGQPLSTVTLVQLGDVFTGSITCTEGGFDLHWVAGHEIEVRQRDKTAKARCEDAPPPQAGAPGLYPDVRAKDGSTTSAITTVNLYITYNAALNTSLGSTAAVQAKMVEFVTQANLCFTNSNTDVRLNLVGTEQVSYNQASQTSITGTDLNALTDGPAFASVRAKRTALGADLIALVLHLNPQPGQTFTSGLAWTPNKATGLRADLGFSVSALEGFDNFTFAHEIGHNFGCQHDVAQEIDPPDQALYTFAYGLRKPGIWGTVMAYTQGNEVSIPNFSNPSVSALGFPTGVVGSTENFKALNLSVAGVAGYVPGTGASPTPTPTPGSSPTASPTASPSGSPPPAGSINVSVVNGWNGIGFQRQTISQLNNVGSVPGLAAFSNNQYTIGQFSTSAISGSSAGARQGFFVFSNGANTFNYTGTSDGQGNFANLSSGYNLCSFVTDTDIPGSTLRATVNGSSASVGSVVLPTFFEIQPNGTYASVDISNGGTLKPGKAYWVFAAQNGVKLTW